MAKHILKIAIDYDGGIIVEDIRQGEIMRGHTKEIIPKLRKYLTKLAKEIN